MDIDSEITVHEMRPPDVDDLVRIENQVFAAPWSRNMFLREIGNRAARSFVFRQNHELVGYVCFWEVLDEAHVQTVAVHPRKRGLGLGAYIMEHMESVCLRDGIRRIILEVGRRNDTARRLYRKRGFSAIGFRKGYYRETNDDALVMEKWLPGRRNLLEAGRDAESS